MMDFAHIPGIYLEEAESLFTRRALNKKLLLG
jgi:hypothetical protein